MATQGDEGKTILKLPNMERRKMEEKLGAKGISNRELRR